MRIQQLIVTAALILTAGSAAAADEFEAILRRAIPRCPGETKITEQKLASPMPYGISARQYLVENEAPICTNRYVVALTPPGNVFVGSPWPLGEGRATPAEKLRQFGLQQLEENFQPLVADKRTDDGLLAVDLQYNTEYGKTQIAGYVDPGATVFFPGLLFPLKSDFSKVRLEKLAPVLAASPTRGPANAKIHLVEFSDFQCPSCKYSATFMKPLLEKYGNQIRYTRVDYPLMAHHPWAFGAAVIGRAVHQQNPDAFWKYKDAVYDIQADLNLFTLEDFARGFASDHSLDAEKFNAALNSEQIRRQVLDAIAAAHLLQVRGTPTFLLNGEIIMAGQDGKYLASEIERILR